MIRWSATYLNGSVLLAPVEYEGDAAPRPTGDHVLAIADWVQLGGILAFAVIGGLFTAAVSAARHGAGGALAMDEGAPARTGDDEDLS